MAYSTVSYPLPSTPLQSSEAPDIGNHGDSLFDVPSDHSMGSHGDSLSIPTATTVHPVEEVS